ncbi:DUF3299 domain-containing protein [Shimia sp.]|uniref:DUF3299 domain-containing protein n=1 Tax=Shimia sp. TaxID=1954381 RepID=UPI0032998FCB
MMKTLSTVLAAILAFSVAHPGWAIEPLEITWVDLLPEERPYHDPFAELEYSQLLDLVELYRIEVLKTVEENDETRAMALEIRESLVSQGLDPDQLFKQRDIVMNQRKLEATEPNPELLGKTVRLPGYLLPLEMIDQKAVEFLLVPTVGACIHTPPPPPNQMVFVRYDQGFDVDELYKPVWISGEMRAENQTNELSLVDGQADIETTYFVQAVSVDIYK